MWCPECRQDVPGIASGATGKICCVRCRAPLPSTGKSKPLSNETRDDAPSTASTPSPDAELVAHLDALDRLTAWDFGEDLSPIDLTQLEMADLEVEVPYRRQGSFDQPHPALRGWHRSGPNATPASHGFFRFSRRSLLGWTLLTCGLASFFCGAALLTWSLFGERSELWTIGVPITLAGQVGLLLGVVLALDRLGQQNRQTVDRLGRLDERLDELRAAAWLNGPTTPSSSVDRSRELFS